MIAKKYILIGAVAAAIGGLTAVGEVLATGDGPVCALAVCDLGTLEVPGTQVKCGTKSGCPICVDVFPSTPIDTGDSCKFQWNVYNLGTSTTKAAVAYECTPGTAATSAVANGCGVGSVGVNAVSNAFKGIFQLDSVNSLVTLPGPTRTFSYTINSSCAQRGPNDLALKWDDIKTCSGSIEGFGNTNTFASTVGCQIQQLGSGNCQIKTCFTYGAGNQIIDYTIAEEPGSSCIISINKGPLPAGVTDIPDGTIIKFGTTSCFQVTIKRKTTWVATDGSICPPSS